MAYSSYDRFGDVVVSGSGREADNQLASGCAAVMGRYGEIYIATPMRTSQLCAGWENRGWPIQFWRGLGPSRSA